MWLSCSKKTLHDDLECSGGDSNPSGGDLGLAITSQARYTQGNMVARLAVGGAQRGIHFSFCDGRRQLQSKEIVRQRFAKKNLVGDWQREAYLDGVAVIGDLDGVIRVLDSGKESLS